MILVANSMTFSGSGILRNFIHGSTPPNFEAGVVSVVYAIMGPLVWLLVNQLRNDQRKLSDNLRELERTRKRLVIEEKLAVVGRLSSAVAHEIRNPVSIIASSLITADRPKSGNNNDARCSLLHAARPLAGKAHQ